MEAGLPWLFLFEAALIAVEAENAFLLIVFIDR
jgi:hypothetical protein